MRRPDQTCTNKRGILLNETFSVLRLITTCEVAADVDVLNVVYGIVTTFTDWNFLRSLDENVESDFFSI